MSIRTRLFGAIAVILFSGIPSYAADNYVLPASDNPAISYGTSVSRNEFGIDRGVFPSPDGSRLAVYRRDESRVGTFPLLDITTRTGSLKEIRYPMNGMASELVSLCICDTLGHILSDVSVSDFTDERYLAGISWSEDSKHIFIHVLDRPQHNMHLNMYSAADGRFERTLLTEHNEAWVEPYEPLHCIKGTEDYIYSTDNRDGWKSLYRISVSGTVERLTKVDADVKYCGNDGRWLYYSSAEVSPLENHLFKMDLRHPSRGSMRLTKEEGWHSIEMARDCSTFDDSWSGPHDPESTVRCSARDGKKMETLKEADKKLLLADTLDINIGSFRTADGAFDNYYRLVRPEGFSPEKKYPLVVYVYGGPHSQMVSKAFQYKMRKIERLLAAQGIACFTMDNRGTANRGTAYEKSINRQCGQVEMEDQVAGLKQLLETCPWIDAGRVGVAGWSYGGFMTISLITHYPELFKAAACGGPVIDWKWYEVMYGERYMDTPENNPEGFEATSLMSQVGNVRCPLLICQGMMDSTVLPVNSLNFVQKCIEKGIQLDFFPYPCSEHNVKGQWRDHLNEKFVRYFSDRL